ncbi:F-box/kelch-repeat protein At3g23880-like [Rhodamnia argentea]|uniref:F-box/kelch-repeat protein At3g23880-like n=1 Tax=Rhodamnia argentea TaxID=178133 RepID=A0A8B8QH96_9MYRT|nr:F-box/kelch-repeat protein At3g23880-like [Rhodamnia argentea]
MDYTAVNGLKQTVAPLLMKMDGLPLAILSDILSRVSIQSLLRFRCVCKCWQEAIEAIDNSYFRNSLHCSKERMLLYHDYRKEEIYPLRIQEEAPMKMIQIAKFPGLQRLYAPRCLQWLPLLGHLIDVKNNPVLLVNPLTKEILRLPRAPDLRPDMSVYGFGFDCSANTYKMVQMDATRTRMMMRARVYDFEKRLWRTCKAPPPSQLPCRKFFFASGALNWFLNMGVMLSFDLTNEEFSSIQFSVPTRRAGRIAGAVPLFLHGPHRGVGA